MTPRFTWALLLLDAAGTALATGPAPEWRAPANKAHTTAPLARAPHFATAGDPNSQLNARGRELSHDCENSCSDHDDDTCDDGGPGSEFNSCDYGTDCADCGERHGTPETTHLLALNNCKLGSSECVDLSNPQRQAAIQCCEPDESVCFDSICTSDVVSTEYNPPISGVFPSGGEYVTAAEASIECTARGKRLCTAAELEANVCCGFGCGYDRRYVWSSTSCAPTAAPTAAPSATPTTAAPSASPTTNQPSASPSASPTTVAPSAAPTGAFAPPPPPYHPGVLCSNTCSDHDDSSCDDGGRVARLDISPHPPLRLSTLRR
jgi:hypothetical protein